VCNNVNVDDSSPAWHEQVAQRLGQSIAAARKGRGMSAVKVAEMTGWFGAPIHRLAVPKIERGDQVVTVTELIALGEALETDWQGWLSDATEGLQIKGDQSEEVDFRVILEDVDRQIESTRRSLLQAEQGPKHFDMPEPLRDRMISDAQRYREMLGSLQSQRKMIVALIEEHDA
jgi:transcriptional regulator with XRE-family HTH domain